MNLSAVALAACLTVGVLDREFVAMFQEHEHVPKQGRLKGVRIAYRLFVPQLEKQNQPSYPLIIWLHGDGESGGDNIGQLKWLDELLLPTVTVHTLGRSEGVFWPVKWASRAAVR